MIVDLHCHSTASDGALSPRDLLLRASQQGVDLLAITDHDTVEGYLSVCNDPPDFAPRLIAGVELSSIWGKQGIHVVGLNINPQCTVLSQGLEQLSRARQERVRLISEKLAKYGFTGAYEYVTEHAAGSQPGRPHFARFLVERGYVTSVSSAFKRYLGAGKPGDIKTLWPPMAQVVQWINASGGIAVLAHPLHYKMTATRLRALLTDFKAAGGQAIEVISGAQQHQRTDYLAQLARRFDLLASVGSDFHRPQIPWSELGKVGKLPARCQPVWTAW